MLEAPWQIGTIDLLIFNLGARKMIAIIVVGWVAILLAALMSGAAAAAIRGSLGHPE